MTKCLFRVVGRYCRLEKYVCPAGGQAGGGRHGWPSAYRALSTPTRGDGEMRHEARRRGATRSAYCPKYVEEAGYRGAEDDDEQRREDEPDHREQHLDRCLAGSLFGALSASGAHLDRLLDEHF